MNLIKHWPGLYVLGKATLSRLSVKERRVCWAIYTCVASPILSTHEDESIKWAAFKWFVRESTLTGTVVVHCFNTLNNCSTSITNQPTKDIIWTTEHIVWCDSGIIVFNDSANERRRNNVTSFFISSAYEIYELIDKKGPSGMIWFSFAVRTWKVCLKYIFWSRYWLGTAKSGSSIDIDLQIVFGGSAQIKILSKGAKCVQGIKHDNISRFVVICSHGNLPYCKHVINIIHI